MHRYLARFIACLILTLALALLQFIGPRHGRKEVSVRTDGQTSDILAAVEALKRSDVTVKVEDDVWVTSPVGGVVLGSLAMAALLWLSCGAVKRIEARIVEASTKIKPEPNQTPQRNAGGRSSSGDSSASETPSSLGPRG